MSKRIIVNNQARNFKVSSQYTDSTFDSDDGMRRGHTYTVDIDYSFFFENEKEEKEGWSYDLRVMKKRHSCYYYDSGESELEFEKNFGFIAARLRNRGIMMFNFPAYKVVDGYFFARSGGDLITVNFLGEVKMATEDDDIITVDELFARIKEETGENRVHSKIARALTCGHLVDRKFKVALESIPDEFYGKEIPVMLESVEIGDLLSSGEVSEVDVASALEYLVARFEETKAYSGIRIDGIEQIVTSLPAEFRDRVLSCACQTSSCLTLLRIYYPEKINWYYMSLRDFEESDLDRLIERDRSVSTEAQWEFLKHCMENPELERKIVENVYPLACSCLKALARELKTCTTADILRTIIEYDKNNPEVIKISEVSGLFELEYEGLAQKDYEDCLVMLGQCNGEDQAAFALKIGVMAGVAESELVKMLEAARGVRLTSCYMSGVYEKLGFKPGLDWVRAERARWEAEERRIAKERIESNERVVRYVQNSGKLVVGVTTGTRSSIDGCKITSLEGEVIGNLQLNETRLYSIEGRNHVYLVNLERVKKLKNGILHLDVDESDAGYIIGPKGARIRDTTEGLNRLGCNLKMIKLHTH